MGVTMFINLASDSGGIASFISLDRVNAITVENSQIVFLFADGHEYTVAVLDSTTERLVELVRTAIGDPISVTPYGRREP